ncbi:putative uridine kinase [Smittium culicis]|uniref:Putative uridine kinase n=1 Tax=Smittium culicis TaxID=133412 RepID=A0A1R1XAK6_9FUNG|nr:putative uridine kinase [Smittium culicis]OMJ11656.1 putative uridine kinase [Smittium culicis]
MDGFHLPKSELDKFPDPKLAHSRRGAHWTFDGNGDPKTNGILVPPSAKLILVEGLYTLLGGIAPWSELDLIWNERWLIKPIDDNVKMARLANRHVSSGLEKDLSSAYSRILANDSHNEKVILDNLPDKLDVVILN